MSISCEAIAKAGGVWSGMSGSLGGFCEEIAVRGVCGGWEGGCHGECWVCHGLRSVMGAPARVRRAEPNALGCAVHGLPVRFC